MILVDPLTWHPTGREHPRRRRWAHMVSTHGDAELHAFARDLGLKRAWFQSHPRHPHYDIRPNRWRIAQERGALLVARRSLIRLEEMPICAGFHGGWHCARPGRLTMSYDIDLPDVRVCSRKCAGLFDFMIRERAGVL